MIITKKRDFKALLENIANYKSFFLIGCSECASLCGTGGEPELAAMKAALEAEGKIVTGTMLPKTGCQTLGTKIELKKDKDACAAADAIIVMSCGAGTQSAVEIFPEKPVYAANDSLFLGNMTRFQMFDERCSLCGECVLDKTGGICPVTSCPKGLLNGPCGGTNDGKCEVSTDIECAWVRIYNRMKKINQLEDFKKTLSPKDWSAGRKPATLNARAEKKEEKK
jgi:ferredoxin